LAVRRPVQDEVLGDRERTDQAVLAAVLGDEADALVEDAAHALADELDTAEAHRAADPLGEPDHGLDELGLPVALHARDGEHLAGPDVEADVVDDDGAV